ncbi:MAG TPA: STAS domain-containing protein [Verrucomicrobiota bacterium]|nr:STAS domain-containing protein [Verrucomicrobiota bacterium]
MPVDTVVVHSEQTSQGVHVVYINGNIICNLSGTPVRKEIERLLKTEKPRIVLNIKDVRYLDSYSFGWLANMCKEIKKKSGRFVLSNPNTDIANLIEMLSFNKAMEVFGTEAEAIASM